MFTLPGGYVRYLYLTGLFAFFIVAALVIEIVFSMTGSGLSVMQGRGVGQAMLYAAGLITILAYSSFIACDHPIRFLALYGKNWRRFAKGFGFFAAIAVLASVAAYAILLTVGQAVFDWGALDAMGSKTVRRIAISLLIVMVLATAEELIFRGFLMRYLRFAPGAAVTISAVIVSSLIFAFLHKIEDPMGWVEPANTQLFVGLFLLSVALSMSYIYSGSMAVPAGLHFGFLVLEIFRFKTAGIVMQGGAWWAPIDQDVRTAPFVWMLFVVIGVGTYIWRRRIHDAFVVEKAVQADTDLSEAHPLAAKA